jgi:hypothetical protein
MLSARERWQYDHHGLLHLPGLVAADDVEQMAALGRRALALAAGRRAAATTGQVGAQPPELERRQDLRLGGSPTLP